MGLHWPERTVDWEGPRIRQPMTQEEEQSTAGMKDKGLCKRRTPRRRWAERFAAPWRHIRGSRRIQPTNVIRSDDTHARALVVFPLECKRKCDESTSMHQMTCPKAEIREEEG